MGRINWTIQAVNDIKNIFEFISSDSKYYAKRQISKIRLRTEILREFEKIGRIVPEFNDPEIRELIEGKYRIVYKIVKPKQVDILTIHHSFKEKLDLGIDV